MKIKRYLILIFIIALVFQANKIITNIMRSDAYHINFDSSFEPELAEEIKNFINKKLKNKLPEEIYKELTSKFTIIKSVDIKKNNSDFLTIKIFALKPLYKINKNLVFTQKNKFLDSKLYNKDIVSNLENINVLEKISPDLINFLNKLPTYIPYQFDITWQNKNSIELKNKLNNKDIILISFSNIPDKNLIESCNKIKFENHKNKEKIISDLRFLNQIIIS